MALGIAPMRVNHSETCHTINSIKESTFQLEGVTMKPSTRYSLAATAVAAALFAGNIAAHPATANAVENAAVPAQTSRTEVTQSLPTGVRPMTASEQVGADLVASYQDRNDYAAVYIDSPTAVRLVLKDTKLTSLPSEGEVAISVQSVTHSFRDLYAAAIEVDRLNPSSYGTKIEPDKGRLTATVAADSFAEPGFQLRRGVNAGDIDIRTEAASQKPVLATAEGGSTSTGNGCSTGFRYNGWLISSASHCSDNYGTVNGTPVNWWQDNCPIDNQVGYTTDGDTSTSVQGYTFSGTQGDVGFGTTTYKWGNQTGWTGGQVDGLSTSYGQCGVLVQLMTGQSSIGGDSGGPVVTFTCSSSACAYQARGTHRGTFGTGQIMNVPMSTINSSGYSVG